MMEAKIVTSEGTVSIDKDEFVELIRESEKIGAVERYLESEKFPSIDSVKYILGIIPETKVEWKDGEEE